tara:strand:+ start:2645 stop:3217 length:573 start_codon:yes stop_codon:yes gene_type:complete
MNVFYDLGAGTGTDIKLFYNMYPKEDWQVHAFEIQKDRSATIKILYPEVTLVNAAAGSYDGMANFYKGSNPNGVSLLAEKKGVSRKNTEGTEVVDFAKYMRENSNADDNIILLIDIEGGEYDLIDHLKAEGVLDWVNELYMEFHGHKLDGFDIEREEEMRDYLIDKFGDNVYIFRMHQHKKFLRLNAEGK